MNFTVGIDHIVICHVLDTFQVKHLFELLQKITEMYKNNLAFKTFWPISGNLDIQIREGEYAILYLKQLSVVTQVELTTQ